MALLFVDTVFRSPFTSAFRHVSAAYAACFSFFRVSSEKDVEEMLAGEAVKTFPLSLDMIKSSISFLAGTLSFSRIRNLQSLCKRSSLWILVVQAAEVDTPVLVTVGGWGTFFFTPYAVEAVVVPWERTEEQGARLFCMPNTEEQLLSPGCRVGEQDAMLFGTPKTDPAE